MPPAAMQSALCGPMRHTDNVAEADGGGAVGVGDADAGAHGQLPHQLVRDGGRQDVAQDGLPELMP